MNVEIFIPCIIDQIYPETAFNTIKLLQKSGCNVIYNPQQTCCGQPAYHEGFWDEAKQIGLKFLHDFSDDCYIVSPSASCTGMIKDGYDDLFTNSTAHNRCRNIQSNIYELSDFLVNVLKKDYFGAELVGTAVYYDSFTAIRQSRVKDEPRQLLAHVGGLDLISVPNQNSSFGFGDTLSCKSNLLSAALAEQNVQHAMAAKADYIISTDSSCLLQLQSFIDKHQLPIKTKHLADVLTSGWANI